MVRERGIRFHGRVPSRLALLGDSDPVLKDHRQVYPLAIDELGVDDGVSALAYEMQRGRMQRRFDFVMIDDGEAAVPADRPRVLQSVLGVVDLPASAELSTYLVLRALDGGRLEIGVGAGPHDLPEAAKVGDFASIEWLSSQALPSTR